MSYRDCLAQQILIFVTALLKQPNEAVAYEVRNDV